jgi:hypothetical protein
MGVILETGVAGWAAGRVAALLRAKRYARQLGIVKTPHKREKRMGHMQFPHSPEDG